MSSEDISFSLQLTVEDAVSNIRQLQTVAYQTLTLLKRMGLSEDINDAITKIQRIISVLNSARLAMIALQAATGPMGWALAGVGLVATGFQAYDMAEYELRGVE